MGLQISFLKVLKKDTVPRLKGSELIYSFSDNIFLNKLILKAFGDDEFLFNPFPDDKNLTLSKFKAFADDTINVT